MDRRRFLATTGALSVAAAAGELRAATSAFDPTEQSIAALMRALAAGTVTSEALTASYLRRIARFDHRGPEYRSVLALNPNALRDARALDSERRRRGRREFLRGGDWHGDQRLHPLAFVD
jgi:amidase